MLLAIEIEDRKRGIVEGLVLPMKEPFLYNEFNESNGINEVLYYRSA